MIVKIEKDKTHYFISVYFTYFGQPLTAMLTLTPQETLSLHNELREELIKCGIIREENSGGGTGVEQ